jgi:hypothetical protein
MKTRLNRVIHLVLPVRNRRHDEGAGRGLTRHDHLHDQGVSDEHLAVVLDVMAYLLTLEAQARRSGESRTARALPPRDPSFAAAFLARSVSSSSVSSPVAIRMTLTALPITSAGRFWPWGPRGMASSSHIDREEFACSLV